MPNDLNQDGQSLPTCLTPQHLMTILNCSRSKAYELLASGEIPSIRVGRSIRVTRADLIRWMTDSTSGAPRWRNDLGDSQRECD